MKPLTAGPELRGEEWREALAGNFNGLVPDLEPAARRCCRRPGGWPAARLGDVAAFHVTGGTQVLAPYARRGPPPAIGPAEGVHPAVRHGDHRAGRP